MNSREFWFLRTRQVAGVCLLATIAFLLLREYKRHRVNLWILAEEKQPVGMPLIVRLRVENSGHVPIGYWCYIGHELPSPSHFLVEIKRRHDSDWAAVAATNHQMCMDGSGTGRQILAGQTIEVPLAISLARKAKDPSNESAGEIVESVQVRVRTSLADVNLTSDAGILVVSSSDATERRRQQMISGIAADPRESFWKHVACRYPDPVVVETAVALAAMDNPYVAMEACRVLACQPDLPEHYGEALTRVALRWARHEYVDESMLAAALATRSETARKAALGLLESPRNENAVFRVIDALSMAPGDEAWLHLARSRLEQYRGGGIRDVHRNHQVQMAIGIISGRLQQAAKGGGTGALDSHGRMPFLPP